MKKPNWYESRAAHHNPLPNRRQAEFKIQEHGHDPVPKAPPSFNFFDRCHQIAALSNAPRKAIMDPINKEIPSCLPFVNHKTAAMPTMAG